MRINKELLLKATDHGRDFFELVLPQLRRQGDGGYKVISSPFRVDKNPSFHIYFNDKTERWMFKDFGEADVYGDVFDFAALHYDLEVRKDFYEIMQRMAEDLELDLDSVQLEQPERDSLLWSQGYELEYSGENHGLLDAYEYFKQFGITQEVLSEYLVRSIKAAQYLKGSEERKIIRKPDQLLIAYYAGSFIKVYSPYPEKFFMYLNGKRKDYVFGYREILNRNAKGTKLSGLNYRPREVLVITGGEKDVLTLASLGYDAISLNSETSSIIPQDVLELFPSYDRVVVLYDLDDTGKKSAGKLTEKYEEVVCVTLPGELKEKGGKDVSDYMKLGMDVDVLHGLITSGSNSIQLLNNQVEEQQRETIPAQIYELLPGFLKEITDQFTDKVDKDLALLSAIGVLSSCFPHVKGVYGGRSVGLNLFLFITAPASSGKGVMDWARLLVDKIEFDLVQKYNEAIKKYQAAKQDKENPSFLDKPVPKHFMIPANNSTSAIIEMIYHNKNFGVLMETEADTLTNAMKNEWGNFSDVLRKAFHHEPISMARRSDGEYKYAESPHLSVVLSGTPSQVDSLISSVENGFFSRFLFYSFASSPEWRDMFTAYPANLEARYKKLGARILDYWRKYENPEEIVKVDLSKKQQRQFHDYFKEKLSLLFGEHGYDITASVIRHGLVAYRIAMLFTILRSIDADKDLKSSQYVSDDDFKAALGIIEVLLKHLEKVYSRLQGKAKTAGLSGLKRRLYEALPDQFTTTECKQIMQGIGENPTTAEKYLRHLIKDRKLVNLKHGVYRKL